MKTVKTLPVFIKPCLGTTKKCKKKITLVLRLEMIVTLKVKYFGIITNKTDSH